MTRRACIALALATALASTIGLARAQSEPAPLVGPFTRDDYPQALIDRPLTLPAGMVEGEIGWQFVSQRFRESLLGFRGSDDWNADMALRVGVTDRVQLEAGTTFSLDHTMRGDGEFQGIPLHDLRPSLVSWSRVFPVRLSFLALDTDALDTALALTLPFRAHASRVIGNSRFGFRTLTDGDTRVLPAVGLAAPTRWRLCDWLWLRAGEDLFSVTTADGRARFAFNLGVGVQPHRIFAVTIDSRIASILFDGSGHEASQTLADVGSLDLQTVLAPFSWLDLVGSVGIPDLGHGFDDYSIRTAFRVRI